MRIITMGFHVGYPTRKLANGRVYVLSSINYNEEAVLLCEFFTETPGHVPLCLALLRRL